MFTRPRSSSPPRPPCRRFSRVQLNSRLQWFNRTQLKSPLRSNRMRLSRAPPPCNHPLASKNPHTAQFSNQLSSLLHLNSHHLWCNLPSSRLPTKVSPKSSLSHSLLFSNSLQCSRPRCSNQVSKQSSSNQSNSIRSSSNQSNSNQGSKGAGTRLEHRIGTR